MDNYEYEQGYADAADALAGWALTPAEMKTWAADAPEALIEGLLPSAGLVILAAESNRGKSFVALDWAAAIGAGEPWCGRAVRGGEVVYVMGEGFGRFGSRVAAWEEVHKQEMRGVHFVDGLQQGVNLADEDSCERLLAKLTAIRPALVIFDTFSVLAQVRSENDNAEVAKVVARLQRIVSETGATVLLTHHVAKSGGLRGASVLLNNVDTVVVLVSKEGQETWAISTEKDHGGKVRDGEGVRLGGFQVVTPGVLTRYDAAARRDRVQAMAAALAED